MGPFYSKGPSEEIVDYVLNKNKTLFNSLTDSLNKQIESDNNTKHIEFNKFLQNDYYLSVIIYTTDHMYLGETVGEPTIDTSHYIHNYPSDDNYVEIGIDVPSFLRECDINANTGMMIYNKHTLDIKKWILLNEYQGHYFFIKKGLEQLDIYTMDRCRTFYAFNKNFIILNKSIGRCRLVKKIFTK